MRPHQEWIGDVAIAVVIAAATLVIAGSCLGCGAGALRAHARAASIAVLAVQGADDLAETAALAAVAGCTDDACLDEVQHTTEAIDAGIATAAIAVSAYVEAVRLAVVGGESPDLLSALAIAVLRLLREWGQLAALYAPLGVELPALPSSLTGLAL